ncbi:MAG: DUF192 domain-containing protein [Halobacteria archaeon]
MQPGLRSILVIGFSLLLLSAAGCLSSMDTQIDGSSEERGLNETRDADGTLKFPETDENVSVTVEVSDEPVERSKGLMNRTSLPENHGMLFVYPGEAERSFWMKNTRIPLDIVFVDNDNHVLNVGHAEPGNGTPYKRYRSDGPAKYVIEVRRGFANRTGLKTGDPVRIDLKDTSR